MPNLKLKRVRIPIRYQLIEDPSAVSMDKEIHLLYLSVPDDLVSYKPKGSKEIKGMSLVNYKLHYRPCR